MSLNTYTNNLITILPQNILLVPSRNMMKFNFFIAFATKYSLQQLIFWILSETRIESKLPNDLKTFIHH